MKRLILMVLTLTFIINLSAIHLAEEPTEEELNFPPNVKLCEAVDYPAWKEMVYWYKKGGRCLGCLYQCSITELGIVALKGDIQEMKKEEENFKKRGMKLKDYTMDISCGPWPDIPPEKEGEITKENCNTLLGMAALGGNMDMVKFLFRKEKDANALNRSTDGRVLYSAALGGNYEVVEFLIKKGAKIKEPVAYYNRTLLHAAANGGNLDIFNLFLKSKTQNVNAVDGFGETVLHWAVIGGNKEIVKTLLEEGADKSAKDNFNRTPLDVAIKRNNKEIEKILKEFQKPEKPKSSGCLPDLF